MKNTHFLFAFVSLLVFPHCDFVHSNGDDVTPSTEAAADYKLVEAFPSLQPFDRPVELTSPKDGSSRIFLVSQKGIIYVFPNRSDAKGATAFLNISGKVKSGGEKGLLGLAFHPDYKNNGYFYVNYTQGNPLHTVISRFKVSATDANKADPNSEQVLLTYNQPFENHNGGKVAFGNDGFLYIAAGDGGSGGDPGNRAQNKKELLGKILRIDVNRSSGNAAYAIPADNPFKGNKDGDKEEIYAYGMRNPWRFSFDKKTGRLWAGDVGQNKIEEVDIIEKGGNYGWNIMEAGECYKTDNCNTNGLKLPVYSYRQGSNTGHSITGGYVCRDRNLPALDGKYVYGDYVSGNIWALSYAGAKATNNTLIAHLPEGLSSFGEDSEDHLYVLGYNTGKIFRLER